MNRLRVTEIFFSLQGETSTVGHPTLFIRLTGCPLRCQYCDTSYAFHGGEWFELDQLLSKVKEFSPKYVTLTGGEPLAQKHSISFLKLLCDEGYKVGLETSGALAIENVDPRVKKIVDLKTPGSGELAKNRLDNFNFLQSHDEIKCVICDRDDYEWAKSMLDKFQLHKKCEVLFSPSYEQLPAVMLAEWILSDKLPVRFQLQMHKYIWGNVPGR